MADAIDELVDWQMTQRNKPLEQCANCGAVYFADADRCTWCGND